MLEYQMRIYRRNDFRGWRVPRPRKLKSLDNPSGPGGGLSTRCGGGDTYTVGKVLVKMEFFSLFSPLCFALTTCFRSLAQRNFLPSSTRTFPLHHEENNRFPLLVIGLSLKPSTRTTKSVRYFFCFSPFLVSVSFSPTSGLVLKQDDEGQVNGSVKKVFSFFLTFLYFFTNIFLFYFSFVFSYFFFYFSFFLFFFFFFFSFSFLFSLLPGLRLGG